MFNSMECVLITGASKGIGYHICRHYLQDKQPFKIILTDLSHNNAHASAHALATEFPSGKDNILHHQLDITNQDSIQRMASFISLNKLRLRSLINNAGVNDQSRSPSNANTVMKTNFYGTVNTTQALIPYIMPMGNIITIGSMLGKLGHMATHNQSRLLHPNLSMQQLFQLADEFIKAADDNMVSERGWKNGIFNNYCVSKAFVMAYNRIACMTYTNVIWNSCCPGWCRSDMGGDKARKSMYDGAYIPYRLSLNPGKTGEFYTNIDNMMPDKLTAK